MLCPKTLAATIAGSIVGGLLLLGLPTAMILKRIERKQRRRSDTLKSAASGSTETKTVVVENRGSVGGIPGTAEVVTTGPSGSTVTAVPTSASGAAVISTSAQGVPGNVTVDAGKTVTVTAQHPVGKPELATITRTVQS